MKVRKNKELVQAVKSNISRTGKLRKYSPVYQLVKNKLRPVFASGKKMARMPKGQMLQPVLYQISRSRTLVDS